MIIQFPDVSIAAQPRAGGVFPVEHVLSEKEWRSSCRKKIAQGYELCGFRSREPMGGDPEWIHDAILRKTDGRKVSFAYMEIGRSVFATNLTRQELANYGYWIAQDGVVLLPWKAGRS